MYCFLFFFCFAGLAVEAERLISAALTPSSSKQYATYVRRYLDFCAVVAVQPYDLTDRGVELWVAQLSEKGYAFSTVLSHLSSLKHFYRSQGWQADFYTDRLALMLKGMRKLPRKPVAARATATQSHLRRLMASSAGLGEREGVRFVAMILVAFFGFLRPSEYCLAGAPHCLRRSDVRFSRDRRQCRLTFQTYKQSTAAAAVTVRDRTCMPFRPVRSLRRYLREYHVEAGAPLFSVSLRDFRKSFNEVRRAAKIRSKISPHSLRHGGATWAASRGWPDARIKAHGRWHSEAYKRYVKSN